MSLTHAYVKHKLNLMGHQTDKNSPRIFHQNGEAGRCRPKYKLEQHYFSPNYLIFDLYDPK